jgi:hypothetical protein
MGMVKSLRRLTPPTRVETRQSLINSYIVTDIAKPAIMEPYIMLPLPPLFQPSPPHLSDTLPELHPIFFIPKLEDRPQNPIVESRLEGLRFPELGEREGDEVVSIRNDTEPRQEEVGVVVEETEAWAAEEEVAGAHAPKVHTIIPWYPDETYESLSL